MIVDMTQLVLVVKVLLAMGTASVLYFIVMAIIQFLGDWRRDDKRD